MPPLFEHVPDSRGFRPGNPLQPQAVGPEMHLGEYAQIVQQRRQQGGQGDGGIGHSQGFRHDKAAAPMTGGKLPPTEALASTAPAKSRW